MFNEELLDEADRFEGRLIVNKNRSICRGVIPRHETAPWKFRRQRSAFNEGKGGGEECEYPATWGRSILCNIVHNGHRKEIIGSREPRHNRD